MALFLLRETCCFEPKRGDFTEQGRIPGLGKTYECPGLIP